MATELTMNIYENDSCEFTVSFWGEWMPGIYASEVSCAFTAYLDRDEVQKMWDEIKERKNPNDRIIRIADLAEYFPELGLSDKLPIANEY